MKLQFTKMHSLGNDFIVIDDRASLLKNLRGLATKLCNRRFGIGADQMLLLRLSGKADYKMRILNADGSEVEMCGNGIRCLGKYIWDKEGERRKAKGEKDKIRQLSIETLGGIKYLRKIGELIEVDMGEPVFDPGEIPVKISQGARGKGRGAIINYPLKVKDKTFRITCVSMGNPHAVIIVNDAGSVRLERYGPLIERHKLFPKRTNVEFVQVMDKRNIKMRVWERGAGETTACGTGASASGVASVLLGLADRKVTVHLPGGKLRIHWSEKDNRVFMTGDAVRVFEGVVEI
ncbi:MAG: diaminopimelate epimerase [Nitrospiraceae bacterium]|nr:MAG: diaminopimelate epimerase [Nitrospiraceae bacterium]